MFSILSEALMTASRMDGFRYPSDAWSKPRRPEPREVKAARPAPASAQSEAMAGQPL